MTADVNVTEKVARVIASDTDEPMWSAVVVARNALAALSDPEVLAGIAGVLREHGWVYTQPVTASRCACGERPDDMAEHQATAVADWLGGA